MDLLKLKSLPKVMLPRKGKLLKMLRSSATITDYEHNIAKEEFAKFDIYKTMSIDQSEVQLLLYRLNIDINRTSLQEYLSLLKIVLQKYYHQQT